MSWSIKAIGERAAVRAIVVADANLPQGLKDGIAAIIDDVPTVKQLPEHMPDGVRVETFGHSGGGWSNVGKMEVEFFNLKKVEPVKREEAP